MKKLFKFLLYIGALGALMSCDKEQYDMDKWEVYASFGNVTVNAPGLNTTIITKGKTTSFYKNLYDYIDVSCNNCAFIVNGKQYSVSTRFFPNGIDKPF